MNSEIGFQKKKIEKIRKKFCFREGIGEYLRKLEKKKKFNGTRKTREKTLHQKILKG